MTIRTLEGTLPLDVNNRPLAKIVQIASRYESNIHFDNGEMQANAKSIMGMMTMTLDSTSKLTITADGADEAEACDALEKYILQIK